jgi:regulator of sirC expression with transglutaminase-like and TPR domain
MLAPPQHNIDLQPVRTAARDAFVALLDTPEDDIPLDRAIAWMTAEERGLHSIEPLIDALDQITHNLYIPKESSAFDVVARINQHLFDVHGFSGNEEAFSDPNNSLLDSVLADRKGLPILLSCLYIEVARRAGQSIQGIGFPTHFLVSPYAATPRFFVDPFHKGRILRFDQMEPWFNRILEESDGRLPPFSWWLKPVTTRQILVRINNNLKVSYLQRNDLDGALRCVERLYILTPDALEVRRDRGLLRLEVGLEEEGAKDLDAYLAARSFEAPPSD